MTRAEKVGEISLVAGRGYENENAGVPRLCIPRLTLQDGPNGIATGDTGVTQLPASLGVAASFDPLVAYAYGRVLGAEARAQGVTVVQGPNLNLARVPTSGRAFEAYGEDPYLTSIMGIADIEGIQSQGVMADAKHFTAYTQETARLNLNQIINERTLEEVYFPPFEAAVEQAHVASVMCAYGRIDFVYVCQDPTLFDALKRDWGLTGFVRSDLGAVNDAVAAFRAGLDAIKPAAGAQLEAAVADGRLPVGRLDDAVVRILREMFAFDLVRHPLTGRTGTRVYTAGHVAVALSSAERSMVLLKDRGGVLPLVKSRLRSVALIGKGAGPQATTAGSGSAHVVAPFVITPLGATRRWLGKKVKVTFSPGGPTSQILPLIPAGDISSSRPLSPGAESPAFAGERRQGEADLPILNRPGIVTAEVATASAPRSGPRWLQWTGTLTPPSTGLYDISLTSSGDSWFYLGHNLVLAARGLHGPAAWSTTLPLVRARRYAIELRWFEVGPGTDPRLGWLDVSPMIAAAARAARRASVAVVFANDFNSEGFDRPTLALPGDSDALISAVGAANPRTVVVLNTGGAVLMPWLSKVAGVLEAWYPGEEDGAATLAVLRGSVDPSGHLPVTFPASDGRSPIAQARSWPGVNSNVYFADGLDIGYRYYDASGISPLFPFGFGLSYTTFGLSNPVAYRSAAGYVVDLRVANTGGRQGTAVVQAYLSFPASADEPPRQLKTFQSVGLRAGSARTIALTLPSSAFESYLAGRWRTVPGTYTLSIGQSERDLPIQMDLTVP
ncbi:MAG TPA: glycoside hydrolase family 3 C-terminal domain-containing protein [Acidimicrobiales bacterium]|nr:glycoside hydrolase family 3 C-terminal domain-containing protein [Acidimicrobiales bacterium]